MTIDGREQGDLGEAMAEAIDALLRLNGILQEAPLKHEGAIIPKIKSDGTIIDARELFKRKGQLA